MKYYILDGKDIRVTNDVAEWSLYFNSKNRIVEQTDIIDKDSNNVQVSTVFLGLDHSFDVNSDPILFETLVIGGENDGFMQRYHTWDEAFCGHVEVCEAIKNKKS